MNNKCPGVVLFFRRGCVGRLVREREGAGEGGAPAFFAEHNVLEVEADTTGLDPRKPEQVIDESEQVFLAATDAAERFALLGRELPMAQN